MIKRPLYLDKLKSWKDKEVIKVILGVRRCGKSTLFKIYQDWLLDNYVSRTQIISLNMEDPQYSDLLDWKLLYEHIKSQLLPNHKNYVFIDEVQNVKDFQRAVDGLFIKPNVDLYLTGSNSRFQSGEWATLLTGRYIEIHMLPLSFKEYVSAYPFEHTTDEMYANYVKNGSYPYSLSMVTSDNRWDDSNITDYFFGIYNTILFKDVVENKNIREPAKLRKILEYIADNIGGLTSIKKISDVISSDIPKNEKKIYPQTIDNYLTAFQDSYLVYKADRYDIKGKTLLKTLNKMYLVDLGFRRFLLGDRQIDTGRMLENVIYLELLRRNRRVYIGKNNTLEVDFVVENDKGTEYYQVSQSVLDSKTLNRELRSLDTIRDHNPKYLLTMDHVPLISHNGIKQINALDWLLNWE